MKSKRVIREENRKITFSAPQLAALNTVEKIPQGRIKLCKPKKEKPIRESDIEKYLIKKVKFNGGEVRKLKWVGRAGAPDRCILVNGRVLFAELKAPGKPLSIAQQREHDRMHRQGVVPHTLSSFAEVDDFIFYYVQD